MTGADLVAGPCPHVSKAVRVNVEVGEATVTSASCSWCNHYWWEIDGARSSFPIIKRLMATHQPMSQEMIGLDPERQADDVMVLPRLKPCPTLGVSVASPTRRRPHDRGATG
jgi:hypothetical protein